MAFTVTPWQVSGTVEYDKLIDKFGLSRIDDAMHTRIVRIAREDHFMLRRKIFLAHRDLAWLLAEYERGNPFFLYTGRGPSGRTHLGHIMPWIFVRWLHDRFKVPLYFQFTDDEKYLFKEELSREDVHEYMLENMKDVLALGFDTKRTHFISNIIHAGLIYPRALDVAKRITFSTARAVFGFTNQTNIGSIFYTSMQAVPAFLHSDLTGKNVPCLIPHAIDQDPHFRVSRDILPRLGYEKPASIQCRFLPGLQGVGKLSSSEGEAIYLDDSEKDVKRKINKYAFSGGKDTVEEHRKHGGNPDVDVSFQYLAMMFEPDDNTLDRLAADYRSGRLLSGELKRILIDKINTFLTEHRERRRRAEKLIGQVMFDEKKVKRFQ